MNALPRPEGHLETQAPGFVPTRILQGQPNPFLAATQTGPNLIGNAEDQVDEQENQYDERELRSEAGRNAFGNLTNTPNTKMNTPPPKGRSTAVSQRRRNAANKSAFQNPVGRTGTSFAQYGAAAIHTQEEQDQYE